jgi:hypothetical protein
MSIAFPSISKHRPIGHFLGCSLPKPFEIDDRPSVVERARHYIEKMDAAVAGDGGHNQTFHVACVLVEKFGLTYEDAIELLLEYNERCDPPWSIDELNHKLVDALAFLEKPAPEILRTDDGYYAPKANPPARPMLRGTLPFTMDDVVALSRARGIPPHGIMLAEKRGFLFKAPWHGADCYGVRDISSNLIELRRMDSQLFPAVPEFNLAPRKSHAIKGSNKSWPLGILESREFPAIALVEGIPDFIFAHYRVAEELARNRVAVVAMLSSAPAIDPVALKHFAGKQVRIFPHLDAAGLRGAKRWSAQIVAAGTSHVDFFSLDRFVQRDGKPVVDLCDLRNLSPQELRNNPKIKRMLP